MFGSLRKKLVEAISKAKEKITKEEAEEKKQPSAELKATGIFAPAEKELAREAKEELASAKETARKELIEEELSPELVAAEKTGETLLEEEEEEEFVEKIGKKEVREELLEAPLDEEEAEAPAEERHIYEKDKQAEKKGFGLLRRITEKEISEDDIDVIMSELKKALLSNDVAYEVAERITGDVKKELAGRSVKRSQVEQAIRLALRNAIRNALDQPQIDLASLIELKDVFSIVFLGFNGSGKTTTLAKMAHRFARFRPVLAAGDTFRAASIEQIEEHGRRLAMRVVKHNYGADSAAVIFDAIKHAQASGSRLVLADTAGRSHSNVNLMDELKKVVRVNKPDMKLLVLDALAGNDIYEQARLFDEAVGVDAVILAKADVYDKGGAALSAAYTIKKPILFLGTGQEYGDLVEFDAGRIADSLLG